MIGVSLPFKWLIRGDGTLGSGDTVLTELWAKNVKSIELRTVRYNHSCDDVLMVANTLWNKGFSITVHSEARTLESAIDDVFAPLSELMKHLRQDNLNVTLHPIILTHLYENGRRDAFMWRDVHASLLQKTIKFVSNNTNVIVPLAGDTIKLD